MAGYGSTLAETAASEMTTSSQAKKPWRRALVLGLALTAAGLASTHVTGRAADAGGEFHQGHYAPPHPFRKGTCCFNPENGKTFLNTGDDWPDNMNHCKDQYGQYADDCSCTCSDLKPKVGGHLGRSCTCCEDIQGQASWFDPC